MLLAAGAGVAPNPFTGLTLTLAGSGLGASARANPPASISTYTSVGSVLPADATYSSGYVYFNIYPGTYTVEIKGAEGSGTQHGFGATINATMVSSVTTRMIALLGQAGSGSYSGGGMSALALSAGGDTYAGATPILIAGAGGGGYSSLQSEADAGGTSWSSTTRRGTSAGCATYGGGVYDAAAAATLALVATTHGAASRSERLRVQLVNEHVASAACARAALQQRGQDSSRQSQRGTVDVEQEAWAGRRFRHTEQRAGRAPCVRIQSARDGDEGRRLTGLLHGREPEDLEHARAVG